MEGKDQDRLPPCDVTTGSCPAMRIDIEFAVGRQADSFQADGFEAVGFQVDGFEGSAASRASPKVQNIHGGKPRFDGAGRVPKETLATSRFVAADAFDLRMRYDKLRWRDRPLSN